MASNKRRVRDEGQGESAGLVKDDEIPDNFPEANIAGTSQDMFTQHMEAAVHPDSQINGSGGDVPGNSESKKFQRLPWSDTLKKLFEWRKKKSRQMARNNYKGP